MSATNLKAREEILFAWARTMAVRAARENNTIDAMTEAKALMAEIEEEISRQDIQPYCS